MSAASHDLAIEQGATYVLSVVYQQPNGSPFDLTGCNARMQIRKARGMPALLTLVDVPQVIDAAGDQPVSAITLGGTTGSIIITIPASDTYQLTIAKAVYDLYITFPVRAQATEGVVVRLLEGAVAVDLTITDPTTEPDL